jgi:flagella basal body P-ring formation protein FlgA
MVTFLVLGLAPPAPAGEPEPGGWRFQEEVEVRGPYITLGDIAREIPAAAKSCENFAIWSAPPLGQAYPLTREFLAYRLAQPGGPGPLPPEALPAVIQVRLKAARLEMSQLEDAYRRFIQEHSPYTGEKLHIQVFPVANLPLLPAGDISLQVQPPPQSRYLGQVACPIQIWQAGQPVQTVRVSGKVTLSKNIVCASRPLAAGQIVGAEDIVMMTREFISPPADPILDPSLIIGKALSRGLAPQEPVTFRDLSQSPPIKAGDKVNILLESGELSISAKGKAKEAGFVGHNIRVENLTSKKELQAQVIDRHTVKLNL